MDTAAPATTPDALATFKASQRTAWATFGPQAMLTTPTAARLVRFARVQAGQSVLDVGCGTGVVSITAARLGAKVTGVDLTPELLEQARENATIAGVTVDWHEADVEQLPFEDRRFDVVLSQFGHMFAPRPQVAVGEMLRVLAPGGTIAFSTWAPDHFSGRVFALVGRFSPPPPPGVSPPAQWGDPATVRERLGAAVRDLTFDRDVMVVPALSPQHYRAHGEKVSGPVIKLVQALEASDPGKLAEFRREYDAIAAEYFEMNTVRTSYLMTRASKA